MKLMTVYAERSLLPRLIHVLHSLDCVHLAPASDVRDAFVKDTASHSYFPAEAYLVELRGIISYLGLRPAAEARVMLESEVLAILPEMMTAISEAVAEVRGRIERLKGEAQAIAAEVAALRPFAPLDAPLELFGGSETLAAVCVDLARTADLPDPPRPFAEIKPSNPAAAGARVFVLERGAVGDFLTWMEGRGARPVDPPLRHDQATAAQAILSLAARDAETRLGIARAQEEARCIGEKNRDFIFAAEETLRAHVAKNGGASHFATSEYALAGRFWTPEPLARQVRVRLYEALPTGIEVVEEDIHEEVGDSEPPRNVMPTSLKNPPWMRPFELLTELFDVPSAREIDPTAMLAVFFPLFFGFMVGDVGYGGLMALAALCVLRWMGSGSEEAARLCRILLAGGVAGAAFGWLVFADMFGIPFHPEGGLQFAWSQWVPASWLPHPLLVKTETAGVSEMLLLSVTAGWLLMSIGCVFGVANDARHSFRHALGHLGQLLLLTGFFLLIASMKGLSGTATGRFLWRWPLAPAEAAGLGNAVGGLLAAGLALAVVGEGVGAAVEFFGLFGNIVSFTRLALVGVSKAAAAIAVNSVLLPGLVKGRSLALSVSLLVGLVLAHSVMLFMAAVSASIQSVRLHFCETFMKFFKGQGIKFERFGIVRVYTVP